MLESGHTQRISGKMIMKVGDLVRHKDPKFAEHEGVHLVTLVRPLAFKMLGHSGFQVPSDWEVISESR